MFKDARGEGFYDIFPNISAGQVNLSKTYPGVVRAFHRHKEQDDYWFVVDGNLEIALYREDIDNLDVCYLGYPHPSSLFIPRGVWHGFRVLGDKPATLLYYVNNFYKPDDPDEERAPWNKFYSWETEFK